MGNIDKTEELLESLSPRPLPQELKEKIMANADKKQKEMQILSPAYRIVLAVSCALLFVFLLSEFLIRKGEIHFVASITNIAQTYEAAPENDLQKMTADLLNIEYDSNLNQWLSWHYKSRRKPEKLKTYQDILNILKEEINGI